MADGGPTHPSAMAWLMVGSTAAAGQATLRGRGEQTRTKRGGERRRGGEIGEPASVCRVRGLGADGAGRGRWQHVPQHPSGHPHARRAGFVVGDSLTGRAGSTRPGTHTRARAHVLSLSRRHAHARARDRERRDRETERERERERERENRLCRRSRASARSSSLRPFGVPPPPRRTPPPAAGAARARPPAIAGPRCGGCGPSARGRPARSSSCCWRPPVPQSESRRLVPPYRTPRRPRPRPPRRPPRRPLRRWWWRRQQQQLQHIRW